MKLYRTNQGARLEANGKFFAVSESWDALINHAALLAHLNGIAAAGSGESSMGSVKILAPVESQEVWAAGVTYYRSRTARVEESQKGGASSFYDRVYEAERPELFFKAAPWRVRGPGEDVRIRRDAKWSVPEPELVLCINSRAEVIGYTAGNDMSSRDIEGENPLYLPQAKTYDGSCALGPAVFVSSEPLAPETTIGLKIARDGKTAFEGSTTVSKMKRTAAELVGFLYRETSFPNGCVLLTGTGVVPPDDFTLRSGDDVTIEIASIGTLRNMVA
jgi:2-dehydro-3-deoxy-D-arabinonate dehydratase